MAARPPTRIFRSTGLRRSDLLPAVGELAAEALSEAGTLVLFGLILLVGGREARSRPGDGGLSGRLGDPIGLDRRALRRAPRPLPQPPHVAGLLERQEREHGQAAEGDEAEDRADLLQQVHRQRVILGPDPVGDARPGGHWTERVTVLPG